MARNVCKNCGKAVKPVEGEWHHVWMVKKENGDRIYAGNRTCSWVGRPGIMAVAEPFPSPDNPLMWTPEPERPLSSAGLLGEEPEAS